MGLGLGAGLGLGLRLGLGLGLEAVDRQHEQEAVEQRRARDHRGKPRPCHEAEKVVGGVPALGQVRRPLERAQVAQAHILGADGALAWEARVRAGGWSQG